MMPNKFEAEFIRQRNYSIMKLLDMHLSDMELRIISMGYTDLPRITTPQARSICLGGGKGTRVNHLRPQFHQMAGLTGLVVIVCWA
jgi:hypothetical protein